MRGNIQTFCLENKLILLILNRSLGAIGVEKQTNTIELIVVAIANELSAIFVRECAKAVLLAILELARVT